MIRKIKDFFSGPASSGQGEEIAGRRLQIAACALLIEMARMDGEFSDKERERNVEILKGEFSLADGTVEEIIALSERELKASTDLWQFTKLINDSFTPEEKTRLMEMVWKVVYADGFLDKHEDYLAKKLTRLLNLRHREVVEAKLRVLGKA